MKSVAILATPDNYKPAPFDHDTLVGDIVVWLRQHVTDYWNWEHERTDAGWRLVFRFANETEAMNFKMRWA